MSIPVICDRCRQTGIAGETDFSHLGDLLEFDPVPRRPRVKGWSPERQRAFIAALSATGSKRQAAQAVGMATYGVDQMLKSEDGDSFKAAFDRAMAIAARHGSMKIAQGVADAAARNAQLTPPSRLRGLPPPEEDEWGEEENEISTEQKIELMENIAAKFLRKVAAEREARLSGQIVAADFYLRQVTFIEVVFDLTASSFGWPAEDVLRDLRRGDRDLREILSTPFADWLDARRREWWLQEGDPERPPHPDPRFTIRGQDLTAYAHDNGTGACTIPALGYTQEEWELMTPEEQRAARQRQYDEDAAEQKAWERRASAEAGRAMLGRGEETDA